MIERVGGRQEIAIDTRVVCATHQHIDELIKQNRFRQDLYYRLAEIVVNIPPLRERTGDAVLLAHAFLRRNAEEQRRGAMAFTDDALAAIDAHDWPGNVRELQHAIKRVVIMADGNRIGRDDLSLPAPEMPAGGTDEAAGPRTLDLRTVREGAERGAVVSALARTNGNIARASELLGVSRPTLYDLMHRLAIQ